MIWALILEKKQRRIIGIALLEVFWQSLFVEQVALINLAAKVGLFSGLSSICLYNLIEGRFIWDSDISRRILWNAPVVHVELRILKGHNISAWIVISKDCTPVSISNPCEVATSIMIYWENGLGNCNAEETLSNVILSMIEAILS